MYGKFEKNDIVYVNTTANKAAHAVGITANCSMDMYMAAGHGKGVCILHVIGDFLWQIGSKSVPPNISQDILGMFFNLSFFFSLTHMFKHNLVAGYS